MGFALLNQDLSSHLSMPVPVIERTLNDSFVKNEPTSTYSYYVSETLERFTGSLFPRIAPANDTKMTNISMAVRRIESAFGLNRTQAAKALFVTRKSIYNWIDEGISPNSSNWERIHFLNEIADYYINHEPLNRVGKLKVMIGGISIYQLLLDKTAQKEDFVTFIDQSSMPRDAAFHKVANASAIKALEVKKTRPSFT